MTAALVYGLRLVISVALGLALGTGVVIALLTIGITPP